MQANIDQQRLDIASSRFPVGLKVCNFKLGSVGKVSSEPFLNSKGAIHIVVSYEFGKCEEDIDVLIAINEIKKNKTKALK